MCANELKAPLAPALMGVPLKNTDSNNNLSTEIVANCNVTNEDSLVLGDSDGDNTAPSNKKV